MFVKWKKEMTWRKISLDVARRVQYSEINLIGRVPLPSSPHIYYGTRLTCLWTLFDITGPLPDRNTCATRRALPPDRRRRAALLWLATPIHWLELSSSL
jgi:hypothetical protein